MSAPDADLSLKDSVVINEKTVFRELDGEMVILSLDTGVYFGLDEVGTRIWTLLREHAALAKVVDLMLVEYDVPREALESDVLHLAQQLSAHGLAQTRRQNGDRPG